MGPAPDLDDAFEIHVTVSPSLAHRGVVAGWAVPIDGLPDGRITVGVAVPTTVEELCALEAMLEVAYCAAFRCAGAPTRHER
jgi:hypothetical protein